MSLDQKTEALIILAEECAEVIQAISKVHRFGGEANDISLAKELGDVIAMLTILGHQGDINEDIIMSQIPKKLKKLKRYSSLNDLDSIIKNL